MENTFLFFLYTLPGACPLPYTYQQMCYGGIILSLADQVQTHHSPDNLLPGAEFISHHRQQGRSGIERKSSYRNQINQLTFVV